MWVGREKGVESGGPIRWLTNFQIGIVAKDSIPVGVPHGSAPVRRCRFIAGRALKSVIPTELKQPILPVRYSIPQRGFLLKAQDLERSIPGEDVLAGEQGIGPFYLSVVLDAFDESSHVGGNTPVIQLVES